MSAYSWKGALRRTAAALAVALLFAPGWVRAQPVANEVPKQVDLIIDEDRLVASNVRLSRFDALALHARERVQEKAVGKAVIVVVTNQRIAGYGVLSGWKPIDRAANERIESVGAQDYGALVVTSRRLLNFNGETGIWAERDRQPRR